MELEHESSRLGEVGCEHVNPDFLEDETVPVDSAGPPAVSQDLGAPRCCKPLWTIGTRFRLTSS